MSQVIVVGGGLAGLSAAHTVLENGVPVLLLEKMPFMGGNSTKATSGINGALTKTQIEKKIPDSPELFEEDTTISYYGGQKGPTPDLVRVLTHDSGPAVDWLMSKFNLDLSLVSRLGGHSQPRTHRGKERFPGMTITMALMEKLEAIAAQNDGSARILTKANVMSLIKDNNGAVVGVEYQKDGTTFKEYGPVIIATGGFGADFSDDSILKKVRPDLLHLPTTNGDHCTGDGIKISMAIGAGVVDLEHVQVHPTGLVDPREPDAKLKFLAAEALRGVGGIMLDGMGNRFCNELGRRDYVTGEMWKNKAPFRLVLNSASSKTIEWHCKHYAGRGLMKKYPNGAALAADMGLSPDKLKDTFDKYNEVAKKGTDQFGKKFFENIPYQMNDEFYVAIITPVIHYCMGGLKITATAEVTNDGGKVIPGLFATGEVVGGVHGKNRLGGNSLLDCVVYGRVSGATAAQYIKSSYKPPSKEVAPSTTQFGTHTVTQRGDTLIEATISQPSVSTRVSVDPSSRHITMDIVWKDVNGNQGSSSNTTSSPPKLPNFNYTATSKPTTQPPSAPTTHSAPAAPPAPAAPAQGGLKVFTKEEVAKHNTENDCWVIVNGKVLNVTGFLKDHPGGKKAIMLYAGRDASEEFNMLHKPDVVQKYAPETVIGVVEGASGGHEEPPKSSNPPSQAPKPSTPSSSSSSSSHPAPDFSKPNNPIALHPIQPTVPSNVESRNSGGTADILPQERARVSFDVDKMTNVMDGGEEKTARRRWILSPGKTSDVSEKYFWERNKHISEHMRHFIQIHDEFLGSFIPTREEVLWMSENTMIQGTMMNHYGLFIPTLLSQASDEQKMWWLGRAVMMQLVGCYGQTELGHGSNVRGLQTIAEYDKSSQQFVLNTPTLRSIKWWPGTLGKVCTHALIYAQLIIEGKEYGVHTFMVQLRDENHRPLPGVELGDLGPKLGDNGNDTGFCRLENVRIPREFMLSKYQEVSPDGRYIKSEKKTNDKLHYATMMFTRGGMVKTAGGFLARAVTIAVRYSIIRTQGFVDGKTKTFKGEERKIIDHSVQRYRLFKQLALTYALKFTGKWMIDKFIEIEGDKLSANVTALAEIAATSAGLKAFSTYLAATGIEDCRKCCGGNGYLMVSGVAALAADYVWQTTAEGDFIILILQTARFLMKTLKKVRQGEEPSGPVSYLYGLKDPNFKLHSAAPRAVQSTKDFFNLDFLLSLFQFRALVNVAVAGDKFYALLGQGLSFDEAFNRCSIEFVNAVRSHCFAFMLNNFVSEIRKVVDKKVETVLTRVAVFFVISDVLDDNWAGLLDTNQLRIARDAAVEVLDQLRPDAIGLVDAFDIPDRVLNSAIGRSDGNVYEALFESVKNGSLNQTDPFDGYEQYLKPRLDREFLKAGNTVPKM